MKVHSIVGYDLDKKSLVGTVIDHGPYAARMTGTLNEKTESVAWETEAKDAKGELIIQNTVITQISDDERLLVLSTKDADQKSIKVMEIRYTKRKQSVAEKD